MRLWPRTLTGRLTLALNGALVVGVAAFSVWDLNALIADRVDAKRAALRDEAEAIAHGVAVLVQEHAPRRSIQQYVDILCAHMQEQVSPGHYILADVDGQTIETLIHVHAPLSDADRKEVERSARKRVEGWMHGQRIVAGTSQQGVATVYVSEYVSDIRREMNAELLRRVLGLAGLTAVLALVMNVSIQRLVHRPLGRLTAAMRRVAAGDLGVEAPAAGAIELRLLADEFNHMTRALDADERDRQRRLERAKRIQERLLPRPRQIGRYRVDAFHIPADTVAGDYWDLLECPGGRILVCLADVSGHGIAAAMGATMLKVLVADAAGGCPDPADVLARINARYCELSLEDDFATMCLMSLSPQGDALTYASAGHEAAILIRRGHAEPEVLEATGLPLGIDPAAAWTARTFPLAPGDRIVAATDGVAEALDPSGKPFGRDRLIQVLLAWRDRPISEVIPLLRQAVLTHLAGDASNDDMTAVGVER